MEKLIKRLMRWLIIEFCLVWLIAILTFALGEMNIIPNGALTSEDHKTEFYMNLVNIALIIICVPLSLKLFSLNTERGLRRMDKDEALGSYHLWSAIRLGMLFICIEFGLVSYFLLMNSTGVLCACIALVTTFFCLPSTSKTNNFLSAKEDETVEDLPDVNDKKETN
jgi:magnesium-transporting ATPase (P-type)